MNSEQILLNSLLSRRKAVFQAVAKTLSFTEGAELVHMSQPAVTFQIAKLEEELRAKLFIRVPGSVTLTKLGKELVKLSEKIDDVVIAGTKSVDKGMNEVTPTPLKYKDLPERAKRAFLGRFRSELTQEQLEGIMLRSSASNTMFFKNGEVYDLD